MEDKNLSGSESLAVIQQMIAVAKEDHRENGDGWLIWGWQLLIASLVSLLLAYINKLDYVGWVWDAILLLGLVVNFRVNQRAKKYNSQHTAVRTYMRDLLYRLGTGFFVSLLIIIAANSIRKGMFDFGYFYVLYAFWMFIYGSALRFRPLITGAVVNWAAALAIFMVQDFKYDMMISAVAVTVGYLIPGYMLRTGYRKKMQSSERIVA